jgi:hypothetical protein
MSFALAPQQKSLKCAPSEMYLRALLGEAEFGTNSKKPVQDY